tara:strand:+ start:189 stop:515 length:327 start_codon:yes stop_codon:yes gene_type:complete
MHTVLFLNHDGLGHGDPELGREVLGKFLRKSVSMNEVDAVLFVNSGVKLVAEESDVIQELAMLEDNGVDLIPCGTCVERFGISVAVGQVSDMDTIVRTLDKAEKVITL